MRRKVELTRQQAEALLSALGWMFSGYEGEHVSREDRAMLRAAANAADSIRRAFRATAK